MHSLLVLVAMVLIFMLARHVVDAVERVHLAKWQPESPVKAGTTTPGKDYHLATD